VPTDQQPAPATPSPTPPPTPEPPPAAASTPEATEGGLTLVEVRRLWPDIVEATKLRRRVAWMHLTQNSQVIGVEGNTLVLGFNNLGARDSFVNGGCDEILRQAAIDVVGADWKIDAIVDPGARPTPASPSPTAPATPPSPEPAPSKTDAPAENTAAAAARGAISQTRSGEPSEDPRARADADAHPDDPDADGGDLDTTELLQRELGAQVIEETPNK
jgi:DNA polymerase-3 subunit gamma/tau